MINSMDAIMRMPVWLRQRAQLTPDRTAYESEDRSVTFRELDGEAREAACNLWSLGIRAGERVALLGGNSLEMVCLLHALMLIGAVSVPLNSRLNASEIGRQVADSGASLLICEHAFLQATDDVRRRAICPLITMDRLFRGLGKGETSGQSPRFQKDYALERPCTIIYTSGTSGRPKGVVLTYGNHWWSAIGSALNLGLHATDCWLCSVPLFHVSGLSIFMKNVIYGMPVVLCRKFIPEETNRLICDGRVTIVSVVANMLRRMLDALGDKHYPETLRCLLLGGGPAPLPLLQRCQEKAAPVYQTYGLTETASQMVTLAPEFMFSKIGSAGKPLFPGQLRIVADGRDADSGSPGEIVVKGPNVTPGYWRRPEETKQAIRDGWLSTGDIGYLDGEGFLYVLDRRSDLIISGGENIYPAEIESVLTEHPAVEEAAVIGVRDDRWDAVPFAFVTVREGADFSEAALMKFCAERLARYKRPARIQSIDELPRNASRKLLRRKLYDLLPESMRPR